MTFAPGPSNPRGRPIEKPVRDMFRLVLKDAQNNGSKRQLRNIVEKICDKAADGDMEAAKLVFIRLEGNPPQTGVGDDSADPSSVRTIVTGVPRKGDG